MCSVGMLCGVLALQASFFQSAFQLPIHIDQWAESLWVTWPYILVRLSLWFFHTSIDKTSQIAVSISFLSVIVYFLCIVWRLPSIPFVVRFLFLRMRCRWVSSFYVGRLFFFGEQLLFCIDHWWSVAALLYCHQCNRLMSNGRKSSIRDGRSQPP